MRRATVILKKAMWSATAEVKGGFTPSLLLRGSQQQHWSCISRVWPLSGGLSVVDVISNISSTV